MDRRWFKRVSTDLCPRLLEFAGKPITYVEIGCWEGASALWTAQNILTHKDSLGFGIDPYTVPRRHSNGTMDGHKKVAVDALKPFKNWTWIHKPSNQVLRRWRRPIDLLYIDGRHEAAWALADFILAWPYLTIGAGVIFDDYRIGIRKNFPHVPEAVESVLTSFDGLVEPWGEPNKQFYLKKIADCDGNAWTTKFKGEGRLDKSRFYATVPALQSLAEVPA